MNSKNPVKVGGSVEVSPSEFVHLHMHSHYSILDGLQKIPEIINRVAELGMESVALTDHGTMSGAIEFYKAAKERGIKPIIGMEAYVANRGHLDKDPHSDKSRFHLILLAMNETGYKNLMRLNTIAHLEGHYFKPRVDHELLEKYNEGLIVLSGCIGGEVGEALRYSDDKKAKEYASWYKKVFGDRYYLEIQDHAHYWEEQKTVNNKIIELADELEIPLVLTSDAHYCKHEDQEAHEILLCVQTGSFLSDEARFSLRDTDLFISDPSDVMGRWMESRPDAILNTKKIAERCNLELTLGEILIPKFPVPEGETEKSYLDMLSYKGLARRYTDIPKETIDTLTTTEIIKILPMAVKERVDYELSIVDSMGFNGYFLIIWDFIKWGKDNGIVFGPGRGSAAGSIVSYALRITELDPLKYNLLFERFLNPDRISMPDVDIDIQDTRRNEVIAYVTQKYGKDRVANIVTFGKMLARNAVRDVARVMQIPYSDADRLAKMIPLPIQGRHIPLQTSLKDNVELKSEYENNPVSKKIFDLACSLEGTVRSHGVHAAGVVIAPEEIVEYVPLEMAQKGVVATQYAMGPIEEIGLLKIDFLGLSNLTVINNALKVIKIVYGKEIDIENIPLDDKKTFMLLQKGETTGVFQLESAGMKRYLKELKPNVFDDIVAMVALYRPGPMQFIEDFVARKHGKREIKFMHEAMRPALESTYGVLVYQEQVMQISKELAGFSGGQADTLRKAIGKKQVDMMATMKESFIQGAIEHSGADEQMMEIFWKQLEDFAAYCFNKSHAACYGLIAYQTAYLKAHYPAAFMAALMTNDYDDTDRLSIDITECNHMGIDVLPPEINESFHDFTVVLADDGKERIRFGLDAIKNVGRGAVEEIIKARESSRFDSLSDFLTRVSPKIVNRKNWEAFIKTGVFDSFGTRSAMLFSLDTIITLAGKIHKNIASSQIDLFSSLLSESHELSMPTITLQEPIEQLTQRELLQWERELLGLYLSQHPLSEFEDYLADNTVPLQSIVPGDDGKKATIGGTIAEIKQIMTKNGQSMAFVRLEDVTGEIEVVVFPKLLKDHATVWQRDQVVKMSGRVSGKDKGGAVMVSPKFLPDSAEIISHKLVEGYQKTGLKKDFEVPKVKNSRSSKNKNNDGTQQTQSAKLYVRIANPDDSEKLINIKKTIETKTGETEVVLVLGTDDIKQVIRLPHKITIDEETIRDIAGIVGAANVIAR